MNIFVRTQVCEVVVSYLENPVTYLENPLFVQ